MDVIECIRRRRSVRTFLDRRIEPEKIALLKEALLRAPSGRSLEPWRFVLVDDREMLEKLSRVKAHGSELVAGAALAVVVLAKQGVTDVWVEDCAIASIYAQLIAEELELGSCWVQVRLRENSAGESSAECVRRLLSLDDSYDVASIIALGYPKHKPAPRQFADLDQAKIIG